VRMRLGVVVSIRAPGAIVRRLALLRLLARRGRLELLLANRGNIAELLRPRCTTVSLLRGGRLLARLHPFARRLLPRTTGIVELRTGGIHGVVEAWVEQSCGLQAHKLFRLRL
jgi:hypothetical protein